MTPPTTVRSSHRTALPPQLDEARASGAADGADISCLSQFAEEAEGSFALEAHRSLLRVALTDNRSRAVAVLFPPCTMMVVQTDENKQLRSEEKNEDGKMFVEVHVEPCFV